VSDEENMKLWKTFLVALSIAILPFALVGVGQAQQLNCWGLTPSRAEKGEIEGTSRKPYSKREISQNIRDAPATLSKSDELEK